MEPQSTAAMTLGNANLDGLPAELKLLILHSVPNISTLQALVRSSPLYYKAYLDKQKAILSTVLFYDIGTEVLSDALVVYNVSQIGFERAGGRKDNVLSFISQYRAKRGSRLSVT